MWWVLAAILVVGEAVLGALGTSSVAAATVALIAPGWALAPLLPAAVRRHTAAVLAGAPVLGFATVSVALIWAAWVGIPLTGLSVRVILVVIVASALGTWAGDPVARWAHPSRADVLEGAGLLLAVALGLVLALRVVAPSPLPGNDWAKYLLYADEIRRQGSLLIDNPFWMLGVPFREDPGVPALYGSTLLMSGSPAGVLGRGILVFGLLQITAVFAFARAYWGRAAGVLAAVLVAVVPATQDILGWHGLPNVAALAVLALLLAYLAEGATEGLDGRSSVGAAVVLVGLAAMHRLSLLVGLGAVALVLVACLVGADRRRAARDAARVGALTVLLGIGVWADLYARQRTFGGTQSYTAYLNTKVDIGLATRDLSWTLTAATVIALVVIAAWRRRERALWPALAMLAVIVGLAYAWLVHLPGYYARMVYFLPVAAAPLVAAVVVRMRPASVVAMVCTVAIAVTAAGSWNQAPNVRSFYAFASPVSLRGLDALEGALRPGEVVVTDRCWSFLSTWLLRTRTLPALTPQDIQPKAELRFARQAQQILEGNRVGRARARALGVRFVVVDPTCIGPDGRPIAPPGWGTPVFVSPRLAVLRLPD